MNLGSIDKNLFLILLAVITIFPVIALVLYGLFLWLMRENKITRRLNQFVAAEVQTTSASTPGKIVPREITGSLFNRTIISWINSIVHFLGRFTPEKMAAEMEHKLTIAGKPANLNAGSFIAIRVLLLFTGIVIALFINRDFKNLNNFSLLTGVLIIGICLILPISWLNGHVKSRQDEIRRELPDALDMLSVCASAGLGFDQSLQKICNYWDTELGHEFKHAIQEMEMGLSRAAALKNMRNRLDVDDLSQFITIIVQAEKIGMSYSNVLHSQALQLRVLRQVRAREMANQLPGKIIIPVILFIFPALIAVILGPAVPVIINVF